jgi:undecaprenyl-diphosphatase
MNAVLSYFNASDQRLSGRLHGWAAPRWFRRWMIWSTRLGDGWTWLMTGLFLLVGIQRYSRVLVAGIVAAALANSCLILLKNRVRRPRPCDYLRNPLLDVGGADSFAFDRFSFPSGHSMNAFALGTVLSCAFPAGAPAFAFLAVSIALSRVVLGQHYVGDVLVGSTLGVLLGGVACGVLYL